MMKYVYIKYPDIKKLKHYSDFCDFCFNSYIKLLHLEEESEEYSFVEDNWETHKTKAHEHYKIYKKFISLS